MLSVFSYNILYGKRLKSILDWLQKTDGQYDIYCFQEFPQKHIATFVEALSKKRTFSSLFSHGFTKPTGTFGQLTLFDNEKINLTSSSIINLGAPTFIEKTLFNLKGERSALVSQFTCNKRAFTLVNAHLTAISTNMRRRRQLDTILNQLKSTLQSGTNIILGDFNYTSLYRKKKLMNLMESFGLKSALDKHTHKLYFLKHQLDYVFYNNCDIEDITVHKERYSDHLPLSFNLNIRG